MHDRSSHTEPPQIGIEVLGGNAVEAAHPVLEPAIEGIHVLDVIRPGNDTAARKDIDRDNRHPDAVCHQP